MKNKISAKLQRRKFISKLFAILSYPAYAACLPLTTPPHGLNTIHFQPLCSSLVVLSFLHYASAVFPSVSSVLFYPTTSYYFFIACADTTSSMKPSLTSPDWLDASSNHWLRSLTYCCCNIHAYPSRLQAYWRQGYTPSHFCVPWTQNCLTESGMITNVLLINE